MQAYTDAQRSATMPLDIALLAAAAQGIITAACMANRAAGVPSYDLVAEQAANYARALQKQKEVRHD